MTGTGKAPVAQWRVDLDDYVQVLEVYRDSGQAVVGSLGGDAVLIDTDDGSATALARHEMGVLSAACSSDGSRVAVGGQDGYVRIYDRTGAAQGVVAASDWVTTLAWSPTAPVLAIGAGRRLLITDQDGALLHDFDDQPSTVTAVAWSIDGTRVGAAAYGGIGWHDVVGPRTGRRRRFEWKGSMLSLVMSPDGAWACAGAQDATVQLWRLWSGRDLSMSGYPSKIERLRFRHDSRWLAVACLDELTVWDFGGRGPRGTEPAVAAGHDNHIEDLAWDPSGRSVATGGGDGRTIVWAAPTRAGQDLEVDQLPAESHKLVTNHDAFAYYAARYGFEVIGTVIPSLSSMAEANPAGLEELAEIIEHEGIKAIFAEIQHSGDEIEALAARIGDVEVVTLYTGTLGPPGSGAETYTGYLRTNTDLIVDSLN